MICGFELTTFPAKGDFLEDKLDQIIKPSHHPSFPDPSVVVSPQPVLRRSLKLQGNFLVVGGGFSRWGFGEATSRASCK